MTGDGLKIEGWIKNFDIVINMLRDMVLHPSNPTTSYEFR